MKYTISPDNTPEQNRFVSISDFKDCLYWGGEVAFLWKGIKYGVMRYGISNMITIYQMGHPERFARMQMKHWNSWLPLTNCVM